MKYEITSKLETVPGHGLKEIEYKGVKHYILKTDFGYFIESRLIPTTMSFSEIQELKNKIKYDFEVEKFISLNDISRMVFIVLKDKINDD
jgi:hypothetical protein